MSDAADCSALVLSHNRKIIEASDVLGEVRLRLVAAAAIKEVDSSQALRLQASQAQRHSDDLLREALALTTAAERLIADARAILSECGPAAQ